MKYIKLSLLVFLLVFTQTRVNAQSGEANNNTQTTDKPQLRTIKKDGRFQEPYRYIYNQYRILGKDGVYTFSDPQEIVLYPGELFQIYDSCFLWRDSLLLNSYCDTLFYGSNSDSLTERALSKGRTLTKTNEDLHITNGSNIKYKKDWKPKFLSFFSDDASAIDSSSSLSINNSDSSNTSIIINRDLDSIEISMPDGNYDSCLIINESNSNKLYATLHPRDTIKLSLPDLGIDDSSQSYIFRIHPVGLPPIYFRYPDDVINVEPSRPSIWSCLGRILSKSWWIGWCLFLLVLFGLSVLWIVLKKRQKKADNKNSDDKGNEQSIKNHLDIIIDEFNSIVKLVSDNKEHSETSTDVKQKDVCNIDAAASTVDGQESVLYTRFCEGVEKLSETINREYQDLLGLQKELDNKKDNYEKIIKERDELEQKLDETKKSLNELQAQLQQEKENTAKKVKEAEDKVKSELEKIQGELKSEKENTAKKIKEAEDKVKFELEKAQGELKAEKENTAKKVKEAEDKVKSELEKVQGELKAEKENTAKKVKEAEDKVKVELTKVQNALKQEKESTAQKIDKARAEEREEKRKAVQLKEGEISQLKLDQKFYLDNFTRMEFAQKYAAIIGQLLSVAGDVEKSANSLMETDKMDDAYYLYRAQAKYNLNMSKIDQKSFLTEVEMISRGQLVFNESAITKYDKKDPDGSLRKYFFATYLEKYFNALVVFNETLAGLHYFDSKLTAKDTSIFTGTRTKIEEMAGKLGIDIATVKIGELNKYSDVQILDRVDLGLPTNTIVSIDNCRVSMKGGAKSASKIRIMIQK